jgi:archaeosine-15-forming tRNA-guanine transglycosylase
VEWCGSNVKVGLDVAIIDRVDRVLAVGRALVGHTTMERYRKGIAVKVREGIKRTSEI